MFISYPLSDAWADVGLHWVYVGVDVLRLILQSICIKNVYIKKLFVTILKSLSFALVKFQ